MDWRGKSGEDDREKAENEKTAKTALTQAEVAAYIADTNRRKRRRKLAEAGGSMV